MARKPNYRFDRLEKDRVKAQKKAERLKAKEERAASRKGIGPEGSPAEPLPNPTQSEPRDE